MSMPSLPQKDSLPEQAARAAQLALYRVAYDYEATNALPMPMGKATAAIAELPGLLAWVEGQAKNQFAIFLDLEIWKTLQRFSIGELSAPVAASEIAAVATRDLAERLRTNPVSVEGTLASVIELAARVNGIAADATAGTEHFPSLAAFARVYTLFMTPEIVQHWQQDRVFGSQRLGGLNPMIIRRVTADGTVGAAWPALRAKLSAKISDTAVQPFLGPQATSRQRSIRAGYSSPTTRRWAT